MPTLKKRWQVLANMKKIALAFLIVILIAALVYAAYVLPSRMISEVLANSSTVPPAAKIPLIDPTEIPTPPSYIMTGWVVNVRAEPAGDVIGVLFRGDAVTLLDCSESWCKVRSGPGLVGWIWQGCLSYNPAGLGCLSND